jgi:hypothetical protein
MKTLNIMSKLVLAGIVAACLFASSTRAALVVEQVGPAQITGSWTVGFVAYGTTFDKITGTVLSGDWFEILGLTATGWTPAPTGSGSTPVASISGGPASLLFFDTHFVGLPTDQPGVHLNLEFSLANTVLENVDLWWDGAEFDVVPEPGTIVAGALLLLPLGASALRIVRRNRVA